ncbi:putative phage assembly protein [Ralstonia phage PE226]|uniref:Putative phage assembly protein n=1 Tax=Ralstonia phage PE226 TaxID=926543 RepID=E5F074_9VIRU|nr:putative phage assembly protein [Ralstonia pseudosolanacearum]YP_004327586.1 putative phage assembly protein [Ralstonia phage PE226]ADQ27592.1 putative phage assembly protein [Ralstonia phage PE226]UYR05039.1 zonular occludens toxin domain-containing protein [Ralstonia pseudosolanacearum]
MLTLITGQPGNGKSLYVIALVEAMRKAESRPVFYYGIPELTLPWTLLEDPTTWHECPEKSIIVIDEVQKVMPPRPSSSKPPAHVAPLEVHRHRGFDLFFMTQDPSLVDNHIKKLAGEHVHLIRQFGMQRADVFKMQKVQDPTNANLKRALRTTFKYPKEVFGWYKSADAHTHKRKVPARVYLLLVLPILLIALIWFGVKTLHGVGKGKTEAAAGAPGTPGAGLPGASTGAPGRQNQVQTPAEYLASYTPRVAGLQYTAPAYDELTKPSRVPVPAACVQIRGGCECWTQQGTHLETTQQICDQVVKRGFFEAFDADGRVARNQERVQVAQQPASVPVAQPQEVRMVLGVAMPRETTQEPRKRTVVGSGRARRVDELDAFPEG